MALFVLLALGLIALLLVSFAVYAETAFDDDAIVVIDEAMFTMSIRSVDCRFF